MEISSWNWALVLVGVVMVINIIVGFRKGYTVSIYNNDSTYPYTIRVGIEGNEINIDILKDMLSYVIPTGYFVEFYFYTSVESPKSQTHFNSTPYVLKDKDYKLISSMRDDEDLDNIDSDIRKDINQSTYNTVQLTTVYEPEKEVTIDE